MERATITREALEEAYRSHLENQRRRNEEIKKRPTFATGYLKLKNPEQVTAEALINRLTSHSGSEIIFRTTKNRPIDTSESLTDGSTNIFETVIENKPIDVISESNKLRSLRIS